MAQTPTVKSSSIETQNVFVKKDTAKIVLVGSTVLTNLNAYSDVTDIIPYVEINGVQPTPADTGAALPTLDSNASPTIFGVVDYCQDAQYLIDAYIPLSSAYDITGATAYPTVTATAVTWYGASRTGITVSKNISLACSLTGLDLDAAINNYSVTILITYKSLNV